MRGSIGMVLSKALAGHPARDPAAVNFDPLKREFERVWSMRLVARIPPDKRLEYTQSVQSLLRSERGLFRRTLVLQDVDDRSLFCWMVDGETPGGLRTFLDSSTYHALKGAAEVLGAVEEFSILEEGPPPGAARRGPNES